MIKNFSTTYKIIICLRYAIIFAAVFLYTSPAKAQDTALNKYGLLVIHDVKVYNKTIAAKPEKKMVDLAKFIPGLLIDLKYAGTGNFMHKKLYQSTLSTFLRRPAAEALLKVQHELKANSLGLKIWDAYRPYSITELMWEPVKDDRYAANPVFGSGHNRGIAVDLTLIDIRSGKEKDMGTDFDNFTDSAHHGFKKLSAEVLENRKLLRSLMQKAGFKALESEWWHYALPEAKKYELLDIGFDKFKDQGLEFRFRD